MKWLKSGILLVAILSASKASPVASDDDDNLRLPQTSFPLHYDLSLTTSVHAGHRNFTGSEKIDIEIRESTDIITMHCRGLAFESVKLIARSGAEVEIDYWFEEEKDFVHIESLIRPLQFGELYTVEIIFSGQLQLGTSGFYRSSYKVGSDTRQ